MPTPGLDRRPSYLPLNFPSPYPNSRHLATEGMDDLNVVQERALGKLVADKYGTDLFFLDLSEAAGSRLIVPMSCDASSRRGRTRVPATPPSHRTSGLSLTGSQ